MKLTIKELYDLSKEKNLAVLGKDGLPFNTVTSITPNKDNEVYFFRYDVDKAPVDEDRHIFLDINDFYEICVPNCCRNDLVAGECEIIEKDGNTFIGIDVYNDKLE